MHSRHIERRGRRRIIVPIKYIILLFAFLAGGAAYKCNNLAAGIAAAGAFIGYALIEIQDLKIINQEEES